MKTEEETKEIIRLYTEEKLSGQKISSLYNCSSETIYRLLKEHSIPRRGHREKNNKYKVNASYFELIDTQEKAYILGFLYADGCNHGNGFQLSIDKKDVKMLERIKKELGFTGLIYNESRKNQVANCNILSITNLQISNHLSKLGCVPAKSLILKFPNDEQVPKHLLNHFIRGYFDGDGSIYRSGFYATSCVGTFEFLNGVCSIIEEELEFVPAKLGHVGKRTNTNTFQLRVAGNKRLLKFLNWLYKDSNIHLERKYNKYREFIEYYSPIMLKRQNQLV